MENKESKLEFSGELVKPSLAYKDSLIEAIKEFEAKGENIYLHGSKPSDDFNEVLKKIKRYEDIANSIRV